MSKKETIGIVKAYLLLLKKSGIQINKAFLYGSHARGEATSDSDIDILLVSDIFDKQDDKIRARIWLLTEDVDTRIEPYTVGLNKYNSDTVSPLFYIINKEGIEIKI